MEELQLIPGNTRIQLPRGTLYAAQKGKEPANQTWITGKHGFETV
jgi:hypothetical protein